MKNEITTEDRKIIRTQFFPKSATDVDMVYCMNVAQELGLNPILKEIYFVERKAKIDGIWTSKIEPLAGKNAWIKLAHNSGVFEGLKTILDVKKTPSLVNGKWTMIEDLVATCEVRRSDFDQPFIVEVSYSEYVQRASDGSITKFWREKPQTMLRKVAVVQALKEAFSISGIFDESEINDDEVIQAYESETMKEIAKPKRKAPVKRASRTKAQVEAEQKQAQKEINEEIEAHQDGVEVLEVSDPVIEVEEENEVKEIVTKIVEEHEEKKAEAFAPAPVQLRAFYHVFVQNGLSSNKFPEFFEAHNVTPETVTAFCEDKEALKKTIEEFNSIPL